MHDRSSAPRRRPTRIAEAHIARIRALRQQRLTSPAIARQLGIARSGVGLILRRLSLNRLALLEPRPAVIRYERQRPGEMLHLDERAGVGNMVWYNCSWSAVAPIAGAQR